MTRLQFFVPLMLLAALGCAPQPAAPVEEAPDPIGATRVEVFLPPGEAVAGRAAFVEMRCNACHYVDEEMERPISTRPGPDLGPPLANRTRDELATAIILPSHFNAERREEFIDDAISRMGDYTNVMTIRQLIDIVAFLQALE